MSDRTDIELVNDCLDGNRKAFERLVERYQRPMYRTALGIVGDPDHAKDVTQNGFIKAWENLDTFDPDYRFFSWLYRIIVNESLNFARSNKNHADLSSVPDESTPLRQVVKTEEELQVREAIDQLKPHYKVVIILRHFEQLSYREIAEVLEIEEKTVKSRLYTARTNLREILSGDN